MESFSVSSSSGIIENKIDLNIPETQKHKHWSKTHEKDPF